MVKLLQHVRGESMVSVGLLSLGVTAAGDVEVVASDGGAESRECFRT